MSEPFNLWFIAFILNSVLSFVESFYQFDCFDLWNCQSINSSISVNYSLNSEFPQCHWDQCSLFATENDDNNQQFCFWTEKDKTLVIREWLARSKFKNNVMLIIIDSDIFILHFRAVIARVTFILLQKIVQFMQFCWNANFSSFYTHILHSAYCFRASHSYESRWLYIVAIGIIIVNSSVNCKAFSLILSITQSLSLCVCVYVIEWCSDSWCHEM